jgi:hypothetical protein
MYCVEKSDEIGVQFKRIALNERQWIVRLGLDVHPNDVEPRVLVSHASTTRTAEQIKELETMLAVVFASRPYFYGFFAVKHTF